jgi:hypothetical protein
VRRERVRTPGLWRAARAECGARFLKIHCSSHTHCFAHRGPLLWFTPSFTASRDSGSRTADEREGTCCLGGTLAVSQLSVCMHFGGPSQHLAPTVNAVVLICAPHGGSPRDLLLYVLPRWQFNVNVNVNVLLCCLRVVCIHMSGRRRDAE